jgi:hypothetical protein
MELVTIHTNEENGTTSRIFKSEDGRFVINHMNPRGDTAGVATSGTLEEALYLCKTWSNSLKQLNG